MAKSYYMQVQGLLNELNKYMNNILSFISFVIIIYFFMHVRDLFLSVHKLESIRTTKKKNKKRKGVGGLLTFEKWVLIVPGDPPPP